MTVRRKRTVFRLGQTELTDDGIRAAVKHLCHRGRELLFTVAGGAEGIHADRHGLRYADRVGELDFASSRELCRDDVLGDIARVIRRASVDLSLPLNAPPP